MDTKTEKPKILSAKTEKTISKMSKTGKPKNPMPPSDRSLHFAIIQHWKGNEGARTYFVGFRP